MDFSKIENKIKNKDIQLLGEVIVSNEDYDKLKLFFVNSVIKSDVSPTPNLHVALFMVQTAIRYFDDGNYWGGVEKSLGIKVKPNCRSKANEIFIKTIKSYQLFKLPKLGERESYIENIKAHTFVTDNYMNGYFDFAVSYYDNILFRQFDSSDLMEDIDDIQLYMRSTLEDSSVSLSFPGKLSKSYKLLKSTKSFFAYADKEIVYKMFCPTIKMIDDYFYEDIIPDSFDNRFYRGFSDWCNNQSVETKNIRSAAGSRIVIRKPYLQFDTISKCFVLKIPQHKFRSTESDGQAKVVISFGESSVEHDENHEKSFSLDLYKSFGMFISDEKTIPVTNPFESITIRILGTNDKCVKKYYIDATSCRIMDRNYKVISKIRNPELKLVVLHDEKVITDKVTRIQKVISVKSFFDIYDIECDDGACISVEQKKFRYTTDDYCDVEYDTIEKDITNKKSFFITDDNNNIINWTRKHPIIQFSVDKDKYYGTILFVNRQKWSVKEISEYHCSALSKEPNYDNTKYMVSLNLDKIYSAIGKYNVSISIPGESIKTISEYLCISDEISIRRERGRYFYGSNFEVLIEFMNGMEDVICIEPIFKYEGECKEVVLKNRLQRRYVAKCDDAEAETADFSLNMGNEKYILHMPVPKVRIGDSKDNLLCMQTKFWYKNLPNNLYIYMPGASSLKMELMLKHEDEPIISNFVRIEDFLFNADISSIKNAIVMNDRENVFYIRLIFQNYIGNKCRTEILVERKIKIVPYFKNITYNNDTGDYTFEIESISGNAEARLEVVDKVSQESVCDIALIEGTNILSGLSRERSYVLKPYMLEKSLFKKVRTNLTVCFIDKPLDYTDISSSHICIGKIMNNNNVIQTPDFKYGFDYAKKLNECEYAGRLFAVKNENGRYDFNHKIVLGAGLIKIVERNNLIKAQLYMKSETENDWIEFYYDNSRKMIISPNNKLLESSDYGRFIPMYPEETVCELEIRTRRVKKNDI